MNRESKFETEARKYFWLIFGPLFFIFFIYITIDTGGFEFPHTGGWFYHYQNLISGLLALTAGIMAYQGIKLQIAHADSIRKEDKEEAKQALLRLGIKIYSLTISIHELLRAGDIGLYLEHREEYKNEYQLPEIFYNDAYLSKIGFDTTYKIINFRDAVETAYKHLFLNSTDLGETDTPLTETYRVLNEVFHRYNYAFNVKNTGDLESLYQTRQSVLRNNQNQEQNADQ